MLIDRTKALLLVGALATSACVVKESADDADGGTAGSGNASNGGSGGSTAGTGGSGTAGSAGSSTTGGTAGTTGGTGGASGGAGGATAGAGGTGGATGGTAGTGGATCDDSMGTAITDCSTEFPAPTTEGVCDIRNDLCNLVAGKLKPGRDQAIADCMTNLGDVCDYTTGYACYFDALKASCPDPDVTQPCADMVTACSATVAVDQTECEQYTSGMTAASRAVFASCMATDCDVYLCAEGVLFTATE
ncbi:MAG: hypothetical protein KC492_33665 [Myxococcales bacterium]|nr:hypothetical protein [Myxococcales bacterium]